MKHRESVIEQIVEVFGANGYPGDSFLQGSFEGCEPYEEVGSFKGKTDWRTLESEMLDARYCALSFFSEAAFRFFLPAYLIADLRDELKTADPLFHLTNGFYLTSITVRAQTHDFVRKTGGSTFMNPRRYGAITFEDYARFRLSVFTSEESKVIVDYLNCRKEADLHGIYKSTIEAALSAFWLDRSERAPAMESLEKHLREESDFIASLPGRVPDQP